MEVEGEYPGAGGTVSPLIALVVATAGIAGATLVARPAAPPTAGTKTTYGEVTAVGKETDIGTALRTTATTTRTKVLA